MSLRLWSAGVMALLTTVAEAGLATADPLAAARAWLGEVRLPPRNYVQNGGFEDGLRGWQYFVHKAGGLDRVEPYAGTAAFSLEGLDESRHVYLYQYRIPLITGRAYTLSAAVRTAGLSQANCDLGVLFLINHGWTEAAALKPAAPTTDWTVLKATFTAFPTKPRPDGRPDYSLVAYWPPKSAGRVWIDNIQIEEGELATPFSDVDLRPGLEALDRLPALVARLAAAQEALAAFPDGPLVADSRQEANALQAGTEGLKTELLRYGTLTPEARTGLTRRLDAAEAALAAAQTLVWAGPAHIPLSEVSLPPVRPEPVRIELTCVQGEHRDVALTIANLTPVGFAARLEASDLYSEGLARAEPPGTWLEAYAAPCIRGYARPDQRFTDPLPTLGDAGIFQVMPADLTQVIVAVDTRALWPGDYGATLTLSSLADRAVRQFIPVRIRVLPFRLPAWTGVDVTDCYGFVEYARPAMLDLGLNTFSVPTSWIDVEFGPAGGLVRFDFSRVADHVRGLTAAVPEARFLFLNLQGLYRLIGTRYGWPPEAPPFERAVKAWVQRLATEMQALGVEGSRVIIETYDEPGPGDLSTAAQMARRVKEAAPALQTHFYASSVPTDAAWAAAAAGHDIVAPSVSACTPETMAFLQGLGRRLWVYDCQANGETLHPLAYYRLMPWMCWHYGIVGWGQFHWFNTSHGRPYRAWDGVEAQNLVYPGQPGTAPVLSRRYLAIRAGHEDYRLLQALGKAVASAGADRAEAADRAKAFLATAGQRALELSPRRRGYETHIAAGLPQDRLDQFRTEMVGHLEALIPVPGDLDCVLALDHGERVVSFEAPVAGTLLICPWYGPEGTQTAVQPVAAGPGRVRCPGGSPDETRYRVELHADDGRAWLGSTFILPRLAVDSTAPDYSQRPLNDGVRVGAVKFEPGLAWVSSSDAVEHWVELDLGRPRPVAEVGLWWMTFTGLPRKTMVRYLDGNDWRAASSTPTWRAATAAVERIAFEPVTTARVRVVQAPGGGGPGGPNLMGLSEVEVR